MVPPHTYHRGIQDEQGIIPAGMVDKYRSRIEELFGQGFIDQEIINVLIQEGLDEKMSIRLVNALSYGITDSVKSQKQSQWWIDALGVVWITWVGYSVATGRYEHLEIVDSIFDVIDILSQIVGGVLWLIKKFKSE